MPRYKHADYSQSRLISINFTKQLIPGTLEFTINEVIDKHIDLSVFDKNYHNDETGVTAYSPAVILKIDSFLEENEPKKGKRGGEIQSNITDNESAEMKTLHGMI